MVLTPSTMLPLGTKAPDFSLPNVDGKTASLADFAGAKAYLIVFMCNHCPYVIHVAPELARLASEYQEKGVAVIGINSNDVTTHPADSPEQMVHEVETRGYTFPYLFDETQDVAKAYHAACTPDFYVFDKDQQLGLPRTARRQPSGFRPCRSPESTCVPRSTPCWPANRPRRTRSRASAATSSGAQAANPITLSGPCGRDAVRMAHRSGTTV